MFDFSIKPNSLQRYSNQEIRIIGALRQSKLDSKELLDAVYTPDNTPATAPNALNQILTNLRQKVDINNEAFIIGRSEKVHPHDRLTYWLEPRES
jgi:hypothetical protein